MSVASHYVTDLIFIARQAVEKEDENNDFVLFLRGKDDAEMDTMANSLNAVVSSAIDCTACANCCKSLVINVTHDEVQILADTLELPLATTTEKYIETSQQGNCFINTIPCHFLSENKCSIYNARFQECRDFPHLHKKGFKARLPGTLMHYGRCPIVYHVIEQMKQELGFTGD